MTTPVAILFGGPGDGHIMECPGSATSRIIYLDCTYETFAEQDASGRCIYRLVA